MKHRGRLHKHAQPKLTEEAVLEWADAHFQQTGRWPVQKSGQIVEAPDETWLGVNLALWAGMRGLPGESSLAKLLLARRDVRRSKYRPRFSVEGILSRADDHKRKTGNWPTLDSGLIEGATGDTWGGVNAALRLGLRGLPPGSSLAKLLEQHRGKRNLRNLPSHSEERIRKWIAEHYAVTSKWPTAASGTIVNATDETWGAVDAALNRGRRGLPGGSSVAKIVMPLRKNKGE